MRKRAEAPATPQTPRSTRSTPAIRRRIDFDTPAPADVAMAPAPLTPLSPGPRQTRSQTQDVAESPYGTLGSLALQRRRAIVQSGYGILPPVKSTAYQAQEAAIYGQILVKWGTQNVNLHELYAKHGCTIGGRELPGIYVICACVENGPLNHKACENCTMENAEGEQVSRLFKVGLARDLAQRFNQYHTDYPYGFTVLAVFVMTGVNGKLLDPSLPGYTELLATMEHAFLMAFLDVSELNFTTRPGTAEFFRMPAKYVQKGLFDNILMRLTQWNDAFIESWKAMTGLKRPPINAGKYVVYTEGRTKLKGILMPYETRNFPSLTSESTARRRRQATMTVTEAQEGQRSGSYKRTAGSRTKAAATKRGEPGGASAVYSDGSEEDDADESEYNPFSDTDLPSGYESSD